MFHWCSKKIRNVEYEPDELVSKKQNNKEREALDASIKEFDEVDKNLETTIKENIDLTSKKLAEKYLQENQILQDAEQKPSAKIKLSVDEKIKLAEQTKKLSIEGNRQALEMFLSLLDRFELWFNIVEPLAFTFSGGNPCDQCAAK